MQGRLVALDGEQIVCAAAKQVLGQRPLGEQRIGGDGAVCDVGQRLELGDDGVGLVGALLPFAGVRPHADCFFSPAGGLRQPPKPMPGASNSCPGRTVGSNFMWAPSPCNITQPFGY